MLKCECCSHGDAMEMPWMESKGPSWERLLRFKFLWVLDTSFLHLLSLALLVWSSEGTPRVIRPLYKMATGFLALMTGLSRRLDTFSEFCFRGTSRSDGAAWGQEFIFLSPVSICLIYLGASMLHAYVFMIVISSWWIDHFIIIMIFFASYCSFQFKVYFVWCKYSYPCSLLVSTCI